MNNKITPRDLALYQAIKMFEEIISIERMPPHRKTRQIWEEYIQKAYKFIRKWKGPLQKNIEFNNMYITPDTLIENIDMSVRLYNVIRTYYFQDSMKYSRPLKDFITVKDISTINPLEFKKRRNCGKATINEVYHILAKAGMDEVTSEWEKYI